MSDKCTSPEGHTETPWKLFGQHLVEIQDAHGNPIVGWMGFDDSRRSFEEHQANGRLIVEAVNAHTSLTEKVERLEDFLRQDWEVIVDAIPEQGYAKQAAIRLWREANALLESER